MNTDVIRSVEAIIFAVFGATSLVALIRFVAYLSRLVTLQETMTTRAAEFAVAFEKYCKRVDEILDRHDGAIQKIETELQIRARLEQYYARMSPTVGRRASDLSSQQTGDEVPR